MCLLSHGFRLNDSCKDSVLQALVLSLSMPSLKASKCNQMNLENFLSAMKSRFTVQASGDAESNMVDTYTVVRSYLGSLA